MNIRPATRKDFYQIPIKNQEVIRMKVLVTYDTKNGSTTDVARAIAGRLREHGCQVDIQRARSVRQIKDYNGLVVGAPIYSGRWLSGAHRVLKMVRKLKSNQIPAVAVFALGPREDEGPESWVRPKAQFDHALQKHSSIVPVSTALFGGADPPKKSIRRDIRDWGAIQSWADELAKIFVDYRAGKTGR
jgi:menaquinone-dependent protoporphyrinogen oxidase